MNMMKQILIWKHANDAVKCLHEAVTKLMWAGYSNLAMDVRKLATVAEDIERKERMPLEGDEEPCQEE